MRNWSTLVCLELIPHKPAVVNKNRALKMNLHELKKHSERQKAPRENVRLYSQTTPRQRLLSNLSITTEPYPEADCFMVHFPQNVIIIY